MAFDTRTFVATMTTDWLALKRRLLHDAIENIGHALASKAPT
jgi:hypothetical protein